MEGGHDRASENETLDAGSVQRRAAADVERGDAVGRYLVIERIGAGGMGVVYAAFDPQLDRKVAIKLLHPRLADEDAADARQRRLLREAQALAKLSHPNVVTVHDAGIHEGHSPGACVFIAMEFVAGTTVGTWLAQSRRSWRDVVEVFVAAGRGLAAAHAADLVHRDMKPDNIMIDDAEGDHAIRRVRVMDFGLARGRSRGEAPTDGGIQAAAAPGELLSAELTHGGSTLGTPAYMAPEQHLGLPVDARTDQFSFCVALWEALFGERPFRASTLAELALVVTEGRISEPREGRVVPTWLRRVVERGLAAHPDARWPDMGALLSALERDPTRRRRAVLGIAALGTLAVVALGVRLVQQARAEDACEAEGRSIADVWSEAPRARLHDALLASGSVIAEDTWARIVPWLDDYAVGWQRMRTETCLASEIDRTTSAELRQRTDACLDERRLALDKLIAVLEDANVDVVRHAVIASAGLPPLSACRDADWLARRLYAPGDESTRAQVADVRGRLAQATALTQAGRHAEALEQARAARADADPLGWAPLLAEADLRIGAGAAAAGNYAEAERALQAAYANAGAADADDVAAEAATMLVQVVGVHLARRDAGLVWAEHARMLLQRAQDTGLRSARLDRGLGSLHRTHGDFAEAQDHYARALEVIERELGTDHPDAAMTMAQLGSVADLRGAHDEALAQYDQALERLQRVLGPDHPQVALVFDSIGGIHYARGEYDLALAQRKRGLEILERALGPDHPEVAKSLDNLGNVAAARGDLDEAIRNHRRALAIFEAALGPDHPDVARSLGNLAAALFDQGKYDEALPSANRAMEIFEHKFGSDHRDVAIALMTLAEIHRARGAPREAESRYRSASEVFAKALGPEHPNVGSAELSLGTLLLDERRAADAVAPLERALAIHERAAESTTVLAEIRFGLAVALWDSGGDRTRAVALARAARPGLAAEDQDRLDAWLRERETTG